MEQLELLPFDGAPRPRVVDLQDAKHTFRKCIVADKHGYLSQVCCAFEHHLLVWP